MYEDYSYDSDSVEFKKILIFLFPLFICYFGHAAESYNFVILIENNFEKGCLNFTLVHFILNFLIPFISEQFLILHFHINGGKRDIIEL